MFNFYKKESFSIPKEITLTILSVVSIVFFLIEISYELSLQQYLIFGIIDIFIALVFLGDFLFGLYSSKNRKDFWKKRWWELFAAIPVMHPVTQVLRGVGIIRFVRIIRVFARMRRIRHIAESLEYQIISLFITVFTLIILTTILFYSFEHKVNKNVHTMFDSFYWSVTTISTIGSDIYPATTEGKILAMILVWIGLITIGKLINDIIQSQYKSFF